MASGLYHTMNIGAEALFTARQGVDTAGHNIANAQTDGYSRQRVNAVARHPTEDRGLVIGNGVHIKNITRSHDAFLERQINISNKKVGESQSRSDSLKALENIYSPELSASVSDELTGFFNALQDLSSFPEELSARSAVRETAQNLIQSFKRVDTSLRHNRDDLNGKVADTSKTITGMLEHVAELNRQIGSMEVGHSSPANDLRDERDRLVRELSQDLDINYYEDQFGMMTIRGPRDTLLVERGFSARVDVLKADQNDGMYRLVVGNADTAALTDVTDHLDGGRLKALIDVRDKVIGNLLDNNNSTARAFADEFNAVHRQGYGVKGYSESVGRDFFSMSEDFSQSARSLNVSDAVMETTDAISVASSPKAPGDNVVGNELIRLKDAKILRDGTSTLHEFYTDYVGSLGIEVMRADHDKQANDIVSADLKSRREGVSGVSIDEEAMNLLKWQTNFSASSKVITTVDEMLETVLTLKR